MLWYCALANSKDSSSMFITVDGSLPQVMTPHSRVNSTTTDPQMLYIKDGLPLASHTLLVRNNPYYTNQSGSPSSLNIHHVSVLNSAG